MPKLSEAEMAILEKMANGTRLFTFSTLLPFPFWLDQQTRVYPSQLAALVARNLVEHKSFEEGGSIFKITTAGRRALEEAGEVG